ncbi:MAG: tryptophan--tRNA ligase [Proteobacteria bacterium]|nr:tryptophan--tRNA ligase [Pseudomonadota bacterium]
MTTRILSGIRPTGHIHLGNYLGAIRSWVSMLDQVDERLFCIVDQHALTTAEDAKDLRKNTLTIAAAYIASGIDPVKNHIFVQSHVSAHTELAWYFNCITPMGWLSRMTQFKDKAGKNKDQAMTGLFVYPALMAADILIYKATHVPVGEDQKQHVELTRDIAQAFNNYVGNGFFPLPEPIIKSETARIMSLRDGTKKMSKSDPSDYSRIHLLDDNETIDLKIRKSKTDADVIPGSVEGLEQRPEAKNLLNLYALFTNSSLTKVVQEFEGKPFSEFKPKLTEATINHLAPIRSAMIELLADEAALLDYLQKGAEAANSIAGANIKEVRHALNMV